MGNITEDGRKERTVSLLQDVTFDLDDRITEWNREHDDNVSRSEIIDAMVQAFVWGRVPEEGTRMREILEYVSTADPAALTWDLDDSITEAHDDVSELINVALPALLWGEFPEADTPGGELLDEIGDVEVLDRTTDSKGRARLGGAKKGKQDVVPAVWERRDA